MPGNQTRLGYSKKEYNVDLVLMKIYCIWIRLKLTNVQYLLEYIIFLSWHFLAHFTFYLLRHAFIHSSIKQINYDPIYGPSSLGQKYAVLCAQYTCMCLHRFWGVNQTKSLFSALFWCPFRKVTEKPCSLKFQATKSLAKPSGIINIYSHGKSQWDPSIAINLGRPCNYKQKIHYGVKSLRMGWSRFCKHLQTTMEFFGTLISILEHSFLSPLLQEFTARWAVLTGRSSVWTDCGDLPIRGRFPGLMIGRMSHHTGMPA